ncbi:THO complex subunit 1 [Aplysia californica]|uniref:THO complex subunit 1 n=1 Tax=Aplysia californica TaxID=6500 RepID=A0ABM0JP78_APLCA|nr:THO complex subunit 1 [Aplysia californica]
MAASTSIVLEFDKARDKFKNILETSLESKNAENLLSFVESYQDDESVEKRTVLDQVFRDILCRLIRTDSDSGDLKTVITFAVQAVRHDMCSPSTPFLMMADIFDMLTLERCEDIFDLVEDKVTVWKSDPFYESGKNYLLRMCNDLIRRLSKSQNTVFCGRIQLFLSRLFPLSEKSALNLASQFNLDNVTVYARQGQTEETNGETKAKPMDVDEPTTLSNSIPIDYHLYRKFWALQDFFRRPNQCYDKTSWLTFAQYAGDVMSVFSTFKLDDLSSSRKKVLTQQQSHQEVQNFFAKYLTSEKLLNLQLNDSNFRRYVLVQFLIIFYYLKASVKFKTQAHTLTEEQSEWIKESQEKIIKLLCETPPHGEQFCNSVKHILDREEHWNTWKNESCPSFIKDKGKDQGKSKAKAKRRRIGDDLMATGGKSLKLGAPELTRLWNLNPDNMEACKADSRVFLPKLDDFFSNSIEQADPEAMVEEQYKDINQHNFQWKAFRLLARASPHFFVHTNTPGLQLTVYLKDIVDKMAKKLHPNWGKAKNDVSVADDEDNIKENNGVDNDEDDLGNGDDQDEASASGQLSKEQIQSVADQLGSKWTQLGEKLGVPTDDLAYFKESFPEPGEAAASMITVWQEEDPDRDSRSLLSESLRELGHNGIADSLS